MALHQILNLLNHRILTNNSRFKYITHFGSHSLQITILNILNHSVNIRMILNPRQIQALIGYPGRYIDPRLTDQHKALRYLSDSGKLLTDPLCQSRTSHNTIRNICPNLYCPVHQFSLAQSKLKQTIDPHQCCCRIRASSCHSCSYRNKLFKSDGNSTLHLKFIHQKLRCFVHQISLVTGNIWIIHRQRNPGGFLFLYLQHIIHLNGLHDHPHLMISILSFSQNIQSQINLRQCT